MLIIFTVLLFVCLPLSKLKTETLVEPSAALLKPQETYTATFPVKESEAWYKIVAPSSKDSGHTHFKVTLTSNKW